jgi:hypothetical protein
MRVDARGLRVVTIHKLLPPEWAVPETPEQEQKLKQWIAELAHWISPDEAIKLIMDSFKASGEKMTQGYAQWLLKTARDSGQVRCLHDHVAKDDLMGWCDRQLALQQPKPATEQEKQPKPKVGARRGRRPYDFGSIRSRLSALYRRRGPPSPEDNDPKWRSQAAVVRWVQSKVDDAVGETTVKKFVNNFDTEWKKAHYKGES